MTMWSRAFRMVDRWLGAVEKGGAVVALLAILGLSLYEIVARNTGLFAPSWVDPLRRQLVLWGGLFGAAWAVRVEAHIRFDFIQPRLKGKAAVAARWAVAAAGASVCVSLARAALHFTNSERGGSTRIAGMPAWAFTTILPVAFLLMALHFLVAAASPAEAGGETEEDPRRS